MKKRRRIELDILYAILIIVIIVLIGTFFYHFNENLNWLNSTYFTLMTLLTVGYGDFVPLTPVAKIFTMTYALIGIPTILFCLGLVINDFIKNRISQLENKMNNIINEEKIIEKEIKEKS